MNLEDWIEARLAGKDPTIPLEERAQYAPAIAAHEALTFAIGETIGRQPDTEHRQPPELPGHYEVLGELGRGGMGVVYLARQLSLGREVAVKVLRPGPDGQSRLVRRFLEEARHMAQLRHPNIVAVHEVGEADGEPYLTMDFVRGESLAGRLQRGPLQPAQAVAVLKQVAAGVRHAHERGIVHRDLKPANILLDSVGQAYVTDFGLAREVGAESNLTRPGELLGTPSYMAPEQALGRTDLIGEATDVHALGAVLYECLTGLAPYGCDNPAAVFARLLHEAPVPPRRLERRIPRDLETICLKCLEKNPTRRYPTARAVLEDLNRYESGEPIVARRPGPVARAVRVVGRHWKLAATALITAVGVLFLAMVLLDHSVSDLRAWGKEREAAGDYAGAVDVYRRAWQLATGGDKELVKEDLIRCARATEDPKVAVAAAMDVIDFDPYASFGRHDYIVAQSYIAELRARHPARGLGNVPREEAKLLQTAERRLKLFLNSGGGSATQRQDAERTLSAVTHALAGPQSTDTSATPTAQPYTLPTGTTVELQAIASDESRILWERGTALLSLALQTEKAGETEKAKKAAVEAFDKLRRAYPIYHGTASSIVISPQQKDRIGTEASEARLLRDAEALLRRLEPRTPSTLSGGIRFHVDGVILPEEVALDLDVILTDLELGRPDPRFRPHRRMPFEGPEARVGVADGTYRLELTNHNATYVGKDGARFVRMLQLDLDKVQKTVTVKGDFADIRIPARLLGLVTLTQPEPGLPLDPTTDFLQWETVPGAATYRVKLGIQSDRAGTRSLEYLPDIVTSTPRVCLGAVMDEAADRRNSRIRAGMTGLWAVEAFDKNGRRIAVSEETARPFLVARGLANN